VRTAQAQLESQRRLMSAASGMLTTDAEWFTARLSVCALFQHLYSKCNDSQKEELRKAYTTLCADETPMVRRSA